MEIDIEKTFCVIEKRKRNRQIEIENQKIKLESQELNVGVESDQHVNICSFTVRCDRR